MVRGRRSAFGVSQTWTHVLRVPTPSPRWGRLTRARIVVTVTAVLVTSGHPQSESIKWHIPAISHPRVLSCRLFRVAW